MSEQQWYYRHGAKRGGPVTGSELRRMASDGELAPGDSVRAVGMTEWLPAGDFEDLFPKPDPVKRKVDAIFGDLAPKPPTAPPLPVVPAPSPPARRGPPPAPPPVPHSMQPPSMSPPPTYGAVDQGNPYAGFGMNSPDYTTPPNPYAPNPYATAATPNPYSPVAAMNQQDILAAEAARAANDAAAREAAMAATRAARNQNPYSAASYAASSQRSSSNLYGIAVNLRWLLLMFFTNLTSGILYVVVVVAFTANLGEGEDMSPGVGLLIVSLYLVSLVAWIGSLIYIGKLASSLGKSAVMYVLIAFIPLGMLVELAILSSEASSRLKAAGYRVGFFGANPNSVR